MCRYLPYNNIRFCNIDELEVLRNEFGNFKGSRLSETASIGYAVEVTLRYPEDKKDSYREYPLVRFVPLCLVQFHILLDALKRLSAFTVKGGS